MYLYTDLTGLLGWGISPSQGLYLHTKTTQNDVNKRQCFEMGSNPRTRYLSLRQRGKCDRDVTKLFLYFNEPYDAPDVHARALNTGCWLGGGGGSVGGQITL
jgi:hypothetical protein